MSGSGSPDLSAADATGLAVAIVASSWHTEVMDGLIDGATRTLAELGAPESAVVRVPGSFELPLVVRECAEAGYDAVVALGVVVRGGTPHFEYVCRAATDGLSRVALETRTPVGFGLLTCDDEEQARARAGLAGSTEDKGREAVEAAIATARVLRRVRSSRAGAS